MIAKHRNRGATAIVIALAMFLIAWHISDLKNENDSKNLANGTAVCLVIAGFVGYLWGSAELASAKGYKSGEVPGMVLIGLFCVPIIIPLLPLIVLLALKDKTRKRSRR